MYNQQDIDHIKKIILGELSDISTIYLFGSYARGVAREDSDMDFAVLVENVLTRNEKLQRLTSLRCKIAREGYNADFLLKNENDFISEKNLPTLSKKISEEGVILWRRN